MSVRPPPHSAHAVARLSGNARGRDGGVREELAAGVKRKPRADRGFQGEFSCDLGIKVP